MYFPRRDGPEVLQGDDVKKLDWTTRNPSRGEMTASTIKSDAVTIVNLYIVLDFSFISVQLWRGTLSHKH